MLPRIDVMRYRRCWGPPSMRVPPEVAAAGIPRLPEGSCHRVRHLCLSQFEVVQRPGPPPRPPLSQNCKTRWRVRGWRLYSTTTFTR